MSFVISARRIVLSRYILPIPFGAITAVINQPTRNLNVQEHVAYKLLNDAGIATPRFGVATTPQEARKIAEDLATDNLVLKCQVLAGGRGKGTFDSGLKSGVQFVFSPEEAEEMAKQMLGRKLFTLQTGSVGLPVNKIMVAERKYPKRELYFAVMMNRAFGGPVLIASRKGGVNIEEVAAENPADVLTVPIKINEGLTAEQVCDVADKIGIKGKEEVFTQLMMDMYKLFTEKDAMLVEINPFAEDALCDGSYFALDAKLTFDDNAEYRQEELFKYRDPSQENPKEVEASKHGLNFIALNGDIGCMVNGAGLAMATMDLIKMNGGEAANFLDVGGTATGDAVMEAFKIITSDDKVNAIFVNIFGGIVHCDVVAGGIINAAKELNIKIPIVVRLQGTNVTQAVQVIKESKMKIIFKDQLDDAAQTAVKLAKVVEIARSAKVEVDVSEPKGDDNKACGTSDKGGK